MVVIGNSNCHRIKILTFFLKHFAPILVKPGLWEFFSSRRRHPIIHVAQKRDHGIFFRIGCMIVNITSPLPAAADGGDV